MHRVVKWLGISVLVLLVVGLAVLSSASGANGMRLYHNPSHFFNRQLIWLAVAALCMVAAVCFDYHKWRELPWLTYLFYFGVVALMAAVFFFPPIKGSRRWIVLGSFRLQPSELGKLAAVIASAVFLDRLGWQVSKFWKGAVKASLIGGGLMVLAVLEPDFGATFVIASTVAVLFLISGMKIMHMITLGVFAAIPVGILLALNKNRMNRIFSWLKGMFGQAASDGTLAVMSDKERAAEYQVNNALIAIQQGGLTGVGLNKSRQKLEYLPEAHTDFIFAIGAEELGLVFSLGLVLLYLLIFIFGLIIAARATDRLGRFLAYGMTCLIIFQAFFNLGVVTKCLPTKGIALPFISYGGTNLISALVAVGVIINVGRQIELSKLRPRSTISPVFNNEVE